jgi:hypothetical protein
MLEQLSTRGGAKNNTRDKARFQWVCKKRSKKQNLDQIDHLGGGL